MDLAVRYATKIYSPNSTSEGVVLTNTAVGKKILQSGVATITGSLSDLCYLYDPTSSPTSSAVSGCDNLVYAMRAAIAQLFLTLEPRTLQSYLTKDGRCRRNCFHVFGVDLIADDSLTMHAIEVIGCLWMEAC